MRPVVLGHTLLEVISLADYFHMDNAMGAYFRTLPKNVQESILQSGVVFRTETDMRRAVDHFRGSAH